MKSARQKSIWTLRKRYKDTVAIALTINISIGLEHSKKKRKTSKKFLFSTR